MALWRHGMPTLCLGSRYQRGVVQWPMAVDQTLQALIPVYGGESGSRWDSGLSACAVGTAEVSLVWVN